MASPFALSGLGSSGSTTPLEQLLEAYRKSRSKPIDTLKNERTQLQQRSTFYSSLLSDLNGLSSQLAIFSDASTSISKFQAKAVTVSDSSVVTASATSSASVGSYTVHVNRLASADFLVSDQKVAANASGYSAGTKSFDLTVNGSTTTISVTFDGTETFEQAIQKIADAINASSDVGVTAAAVKDTSSTVRLTLTAKDTGQSNAITFTDPDGVLANLGITTSLFADPANRTTFTSSAAGYGIADTANLNAEFKLNGITIVRESNTVDDVLSGVTLTLKKAQDPSDPDVTMTVSVNAEGVKNNVQPLLDAYNNVLKKLESNDSILQSDFALRVLKTDLRTLASSEIGTGTYKYLRDVGITINDDGTLTISDMDTFREAVSTDASAVAQLFEDFAQAVDAKISSFVGDSGLLTARKESISSQIENINKRIDTLEERLNDELKNVADQYTSMLNLYIQAQQQLQLLSTFSLGLGNFNTGSPGSFL